MTGLNIFKGAGRQETPHYKLEITTHPGIQTSPHCRAEQTRGLSEFLIIRIFIKLSEQFFPVMKIFCFPVNFNEIFCLTISLYLYQINLNGREYRNTILKSKNGEKKLCIKGTTSWAKWDVSVNWALSFIKVHIKRQNQKWSGLQQASFEERR